MSKFARRELVRNPNGTLGVIFVDTYTGKRIPDARIKHYKIVGASNSKYNFDFGSNKDNPAKDKEDKIKAFLHDTSHGPDGIDVPVTKGGFPSKPNSSVDKTTSTNTPNSYTDPVSHETRTSIGNLTPSNDTSMGLAPTVGGTSEAYAAREGIAAVESRGSGDYSALGPVSPTTGDRAYGRYQVMGNNIPAWTKEVLGTAMTPQEFLKDTKAQDAVVEAKLSEYKQKYGTWEDAASTWFSGQPLKGNTRKDYTGTSVPDYVSKFSSAMASVKGQAVDNLNQDINQQSVLSPDQVKGFASQVAPQVVKTTNDPNSSFKTTKDYGNLPNLDRDSLGFFSNGVPVNKVQSTTYDPNTMAPVSFTPPSNFSVPSPSIPGDFGDNMDNTNQIDNSPTDRASFNDPLGVNDTRVNDAVEQAAGIGSDGRAYPGMTVDPNNDRSMSTGITGSPPSVTSSSGGSNSSGFTAPNSSGSPDDRGGPSTPSTPSTVGSNSTGTASVDNDPDSRGSVSTGGGFTAPKDTNSSGSPDDRDSKSSTNDGIGSWDGW